MNTDTVTTDSPNYGCWLTTDPTGFEGGILETDFIVRNLFNHTGIFPIINIVCMLLLSAAPAPCLSACTDDFPAYSRIFVFGSKSYITKIYHKELKKTPAWDAAEPNLPLAPGTAGRLALAQAGSFFPPHQGNAHAITSDPCSASDNAGMWEISSISLNQFPGSDYWHYIVELLPRGTTGHGMDAAAIGVLMDGRIITLASHRHRFVVTSQIVCPQFSDHACSQFINSLLSTVKKENLTGHHCHPYLP
jgi:hypothetical protein